MSSESPAKDKLIIALDTPEPAMALDLARRLAPHVGLFKVGLELFTAAGPAVVGDLQALGARVFLDLKFLDIPNTVAGAVRSARALGVDFLTVHLAGGREMLGRAAEAAGDSLTLLGVTVLTSSDTGTLAETGVTARAVEDQVLRLARLGIESGIHGLVASPLEITLLRQILGSTIPVVTPGIRPADGTPDDQKRTLTPAQAIRNGASHIVVGRPVTQAPDPAAAATAILESIASPAAAPPSP